MRHTQSIPLLAAAALALVVPGAHAALRAPAQQAPAAGTQVQASPTLTWGAVRGAAQYEYQLAADRRFGSVVASLKTRNTAATLKDTLIDGEYFWRVRAISATPRAGRWSTTRRVTKRWSQAPKLVAPTTDFGAVWPSSPLVLRWSPVAHATSYLVVVATDPSLAQPVLGSVARPQVTQGTTLAFPGTLSGGQYYWQITPVDSDGHKGTPSTVGRFGWAWPSGLTPAVKDLNPAREVFDPLLSWSAVPGAARYDVEVNTTAEFAPGSKVYTAGVIGTSVSPTTQLPNNTYYWRVRAVDPDGRAGGFATGSFAKEFDAVAPSPTVPGLTINTGATPLAPGATTSDPVLTWAPVPGAAEYEVAVVPKPGGLCDWSAGGTFGGSSVKSARTANPFLDVAYRSAGGPDPGIGVASRQVHQLVDGVVYCARVRAVDGAGNVSQFTYLGGANNTAAFTYAAPPPVADGPCDALPAAVLTAPTPGQTLPRTPRFHWSPVAGAKSYYVVVARDQSLTNLVDLAFTDRTYYTPRKTYEDETTGYYWAVWPSPTATGACPSTTAAGAARFDKASVAPTLQGPEDSAVIAEQPAFRWGSAEGAKDYRFQVARDVDFKELVDNQVTASTAYAGGTTYPVDTRLFWRVRARDADDVELAWSPTRSFRRTLPVPVLDPANPTTGGTIPVLSWAPVAGAVSYGLHVDKVGGGAQDFTVATPRFTPTEFYGNGIWKWKVRANFPVSGSSTVSGPYTPAQDFVRRILAPTRPKAELGAHRVLFSWDADAAGREYRLEVARDDSFTDKVESITTPNTSYAPLMERAYTDRGPLYWRVAVLDTGNNLGAYVRGDLRRGRALKVKLSRRTLVRSRLTRLVVTVTDAAGKRVRGSAVTVLGAGARARRTTGSRGTATLRIRPSRKGSIKVTASRKGYAAAHTTLRAS